MQGYEFLCFVFCILYFLIHPIMSELSLPQFYNFLKEMEKAKIAMATLE